MQKALVIFITALVIALPVSVRAAGAPPKVMVSIKPLHSFVVALMQDIATPELIITGQGTPYNYKMPDAQRQRLTKADLIIWAGPELEAFLQKPLGQVGTKTRIVELLANQELKILPARWAPEQRDPFFWLDVRNAELLVNILFQALVTTDPARSAGYEKNRLRLIRQISHLDRELEYRFRSVASGLASAYHDTQQYFEQAYAFRLLAPLSATPGQPADTARLFRAIAGMNGKKKRCFFVENGLPQDNLSLLEKHANVEIITLDSLATKETPGPMLYEKMMRSNFDAIANCFKKNGMKYKDKKDPSRGQQ